jgi:acetyl-CoA acetyltransferase
MKAAAAVAAGKFKEEIVPVHTKVNLVFYFSF